MAVSAVAFGITIPLGALALDASEPSAPYAFVAVRFLAGGVLLSVALGLLDRFGLRRAAPQPAGRVEGRADGDGGPAGQRRRVTRSAALRCVPPLLGGYLALTVGLDQTSSTTAAFLSYLLVVIVPVLMAIGYRRLPSGGVAVGIVLSVAGLERLTGGGGRFGSGELLCLLAALLFAVHVIVLGRAATDPAIDPLRLTALQLSGVGVLALPAALIVDGASFTARWWLLGLVTASVGVVALTLQTIGQRTVPPSRTALLLMIDPVVAAGGGYLLGERIGWPGLVGAGLILVGIATAELVPRPLDRVRERQER